MKPTSSQQLLTGLAQILQTKCRNSVRVGRVSNVQKSIWEDNGTLLGRWNEQLRMLKPFFLLIYGKLKISKFVNY